MGEMFQTQAARRSWLGPGGHAGSHPLLLEMNEEEKLLEAQAEPLPEQLVTHEDRLRTCPPAELWKAHASTETEHNEIFNREKHTDAEKNRSCWI